MIYTTLNKIRDKHPCDKGWVKLLKSLGKKEADDEPLSLETILQSNGIADALWVTRTLPEHSKKWRLYAVWCARQVQHLMTDERSIAAIDMAEAYANGLVSDAELEAAREAAREAMSIATRAAALAATSRATRAAALAATSRAARAAALAAAWGAAREAAWEAAWAASREATWEAAWKAAWEAVREAQSKEFLRVISGD